MESIVHGGGGNVKGVNKLHCCWDLQGIMDRNRSLNN
jgi:hypothetical protein